MLVLSLRSCHVQGDSQQVQQWQWTGMHQASEEAGLERGTGPPMLMVAYL